jgi:alpha-amylase/alpha-mannosidase (GH57 family)
VSNLNPLKLLFIWHHHQPYYKADGTFLMPWVRMHGIKDYWDMVRILDDYPQIRQTFNFTPSLLEQIREYLKGNAADVAYDLSMKNPESFTDDDRLQALKIFFMANPERMIKRYPRYAELFAKQGTAKSEEDVRKTTQDFSAQDFRDLQVWWNLSWVGEYSRFDPPFKYYLDKERNFTEEEKSDLLKSQLGILQKIVPHHLKALERGQIEISVTPFYHPILPLLCDTNSGREANPDTTLPKNRFSHPEDAIYQVESGLDYAEKLFGVLPRGMWPSEGSVSDAALNIMIKNRISWTATDELNLQKSLLKSGKRISGDFIEKYFAYSFGKGRNSIKIFFRDHTLSDLIGFTYSRWSPDDAANDFVSRLLKIRDSIQKQFDESMLNYAVVPIILDGENAWEFYQSDGKDFLRTLYYKLSNEPRIQTVLPSEVKVEQGHSLNHIVPGSWINGDFKIWIGHPEDNKAWDLLYQARDTFEKLSKKKSSSLISMAHKELMIAEGSDWCWWYGDEHKSPQANQFDDLFRYHLKQVYNLLGTKPPAALDEPIKKKGEQIYLQPTRMISPKLDKAEKEWDGAGVLEGSSGAMQKAGTLIKRIYFGNDLTNFYLRIDSNEKASGQKIVISSVFDPKFSIEIGEDFIFRTEGGAQGLELGEYYRNDETKQLAIKLGKTKPGEIVLTVSVHDKDNNLIESFPNQDTVRFRVVQ